MNAVKLQINEGNLLKNLRYTFTNSVSFIAELMQNARRSGASIVNIDSTSDRNGKLLNIIVSDDGSGIDDFQTLLTVAKSGWNEQTQNQERPFGMGFMAAIFSAGHIRVESNGRLIDFDREDLIAGGSVDVFSDEDPLKGTIIELTDLEIESTELRDAVYAFAKGFPITAYFNGEEIARPHARNPEQMIRTPVGFVDVVDGGKPLSEMEDLCLNDKYALYLQGLPIKQTRSFEKTHWVVHLDPKRFTPRMPDRDMLMDQGKAEAEIRSCIEQIMRDELARRLAVMGPDEFILKHFTDAQRWAKDMLSKIDRVPASYIKRVIGYPCNHVLYTDPTYKAAINSGGVVTQSDLRQGKYELVDLSQYDGEDTLSWMLAWKRGQCLVDAYELETDHWIRQYIKPVENDTLSLKIKDGQTEVKYSGDRLDECILFCEGFSIVDQNGHEEYFDDCAVYHDGFVVYPRGLGCKSTEVLFQITDFVYDERYDDGWCENEEAAFMKALRAHLAPDKCEVIRFALLDADLGSNSSFKGKSFKVTFDSDRITVIEA